MKLKPRLEDYTEMEFLKLVEMIFKENTAPDDEPFEQLLDHF